MNLPKIADLDTAGKKILVRLDLDLPDGDDSRLEASKETLDYLVKNKARIIIIAHKGQPEGKVDGNLSLVSMVPKIEKLIGAKVKFVYDTTGHEAKIESENLQEGEILLLENLRFDAREEENDEAFAKSLASLAEVYVNESFATSHRNHASIIGISKLLPRAAGFRFIKEVENISKVFEEPKKPVLVLISGIKKDKVEMAKKLSTIYDKVLVGGRLPEFFGDAGLESVRLQKGRLIIGNLNMDKEDITLHTIDKFKKEINKAGIIVLAGVLGKYEDAGHIQGTKETFEAVANSPAYKIAGGGDTEAALTTLNLKEKFDWVSVGGGAMLEFLVQKTLPGLQALLE